MVTKLICIAVLFLLASFVIAQMPKESVGGGGGGGVTAADVILTDTYANLPAASTAGRLFLPTDSPYYLRDTGSAWASFLFGYGTVTQPTSGDFAWINQGGAAVSTTKGGVILTIPGNASASVRIRKKAAPSTPYIITAAILATSFPEASNYYGIGWRQSSDGKLVTLTTGFSGVGGDIEELAVYKWTNETTYNANYYRGSPSISVSPTYLRIADDGSNRKCSYSNDGQNFIEIHSVGRTDFLTADEVLFWGSSSDAGGSKIQIWLLHWVEE